MSEFSYSKNGLTVRGYSDTHVTASLSAMYDNERRTIVTLAHYPQSAEGAENPCHEFYSLDLTLRGNESPYTSTSISAHLTREDVERLHFATGELLAQSEGLSRGAAHSRVVCDPQDEEKGFDGLPVNLTVKEAGEALDAEGNAGCENCGVNDRAEGFDTCQPCMQDAGTFGAENAG